MNTKLHAVADENDLPLSFSMTAGQVSDDTGPAVLLDEMPKAQWLLGAAIAAMKPIGSRDVLQAKGVQPCIPGRRSHNEPVRYDKRRYRRRNRMRSYMVASKTGDASPPATIAAQPSSSPSSHSLPRSFSGCDQQVLTLEYRGL